MKKKNCIRILPLLLLTALALSGTAAAADYGTFFVYQNETGLPDGVWTYGASTVTVIDGEIYPGENFVQGTYKQGDNTIFISYPTAVYSAVASLDDVVYIVENGGNVYEGSDLSLEIVSVNYQVPVTELIVTYPNGTVMRHNTIEYTLPAEAQTGTYKVQALFDEAYFVPGTPANLLLDQNGFAFTVVEETAVSISSSVDTVYNGNAIAITVTGMPGREYTIEALGFDVIENQILEIQKTETANQYRFTMPNIGKVTFHVTVNTTGNSASVKLVGVDNAKVVFTVVTDSSTGGGCADCGKQWTISTDKMTYYLGDSFTISGISTCTDTVILQIEGINYKRILQKVPVVNGTWNVTISSESRYWFPKDVNIRWMDCGTYTITAADSYETLLSFPEDEEEEYPCSHMATASVVFECPYVNLNQPSNVSKGGSITLSGNVTGAIDSLQYFLFGPSNLTTGLISVSDDKTFSTEIMTEGFDIGQYFLVLQYSPYDLEHNIVPVIDANGSDTCSNIMRCWWKEYWWKECGWKEIYNSYRFALNIHQPARAAQALSHELDTQRIDDMHVKSSFIISPRKDDTDVFTLEAYVTETDNELQYSVSGFCVGEDTVSFYLQYPDGSIRTLSEKPVSCDASSYYSTTLIASDVITAGEYTLYAVAGVPLPDISSITACSYTSFVHDVELRGVLESDVMVKGTEARISGNTSTESDLRYYLFGPSEIKTGDVSILNGTYEFILDTDSMNPGTYTVVLHTAGNDSIFDIGFVDSSFWMNRFGSYMDKEDRVETLIDSAEAFGATIKDFYIDDKYQCFSFTITESITAGELPLSLSLQNGWNFISIPKTLATGTASATTLFAEVDTADNAILGYNASAQGWEQITASEIIKPLVGYWVYSNGTVDVPLSYVTDPTVPAVKQLYTGWNAVGVSAHEAVTADTVFSGTNWRVALPWNLSEGLWGRAVVNGGGASNSAEQYMTLGNGIWLYVDTNGTMIGLTA